MRRVVVVLALTACTTEDLATTSQNIITGCPKWGCGENSPIMGAYEFIDLNTNGLANDAGVRIVNFQAGSPVKTYNPVVTSSHLVAIDPNGGPSLTGAALAGGWFNLWSPAGAYKLYVKKVNPKASSQVKFWVGPASQIETYELTYTGPRTTSGVLCNNPPERDSREGGNHVWEAPLEAILYTGDRYDGDLKTLTASTYGTTVGWFNIACAGSALAKLHLNRHTTASATFGYTTTAAQRQAMLKMYVSDVCGTGSAWTYAGTPLHWQNTGGWNTLVGNEFAFEARWTENGATCLDTHRRGHEFQNTTHIYGECQPPPCNGNVAAPVFDGGYLVTAVPVDPN